MHSLSKKNYAQLVESEPTRSLYLKYRPFPSSLNEVELQISQLLQIIGYPLFKRSKPPKLTNFNETKKELTEAV